MNFPRIQIQTTDMKVNMQITDPVQRISQPKASQTIEQPHGILKITKTDSKLEIDSSQAWSDMGLLKISESVEKYANEGRQAALKSISKSVQEGRQMMENSGKGQGRSIIANIAKQNNGPHRVPFNIKFIPSVGSVKVEFTPGEVDVNYTPQKPRIDSQVNMPQYDYTPGKVTHDVVQYPSVEIDVIK